MCEGRANSDVMTELRLALYELLASVDAAAQLASGRPAPEGCVELARVAADRLAAAEECARAASALSMPETKPLVAMRVALGGLRDALASLHGPRRKIAGVAVPRLLLHMKARTLSWR